MIGQVGDGYMLFCPILCNYPFLHIIHLIIQSLNFFFEPADLPDRCIIAPQLFYFFNYISLFRLGKCIKFQHSLCCTTSIPDI